MEDPTPKLDISPVEIETVAVAGLRGCMLVEYSTSIAEAIRDGLVAHQELQDALDVANANRQDYVTMHDRKVVEAAYRYKEAELTLMQAMLDYTTDLTGGSGAGPAGSLPSIRDLFPK
jgi:hypothetical protein